eukprot:gnl/TRDRNA2_/TRDRNA2_167255_c0_seq2.p1 gnl/TRDRNA2_/TRDRNA2_167255_c0~~gnl/TRDRNA2_/TRDRNA2_167255_c0_seq2.p1  ORF type:complete len:431 (+),score=43.01 gnl/TRDRNA2_/TRDRNA2_167255_c0_seq2:79-1371(+)
MTSLYLLAFFFAWGPCARVAAERIVALADLHGDYDHALTVLRAAGLVKVEAAEANCTLMAEQPPWPQGTTFSKFKPSEVRWCGGAATLIQLGDIVDRGAFAKDLYALFWHLRHEAAASGGQVLNLLGNHEVMNLMGDWRYVSRSDEAEFGGSLERKQAFAPTGWIGKDIRENYLTAVVQGGVLFVHAGLMPEHAKSGVDVLNVAVRAALGAQDLLRKRKRYVSWMALISPWAARVLSRTLTPGREHLHLLKRYGPLWNRRFATGKERDACPLLQQTLELVNASRMVVGHTQVKLGEVGSRCDGQLLMADTIMSKAYPCCWSSELMTEAGCEAALWYLEVQAPDVFSLNGEKASSHKVVAVHVDPRDGSRMEECVVPCVGVTHTGWRKLLRWVPRMKFWYCMRSRRKLSWWQRRVRWAFRRKANLSKHFGR